MNRIKDSPCVTTLYLQVQQKLAMSKSRDRGQAQTYATFIISLTLLQWTNRCRGLHQRVWRKSVRSQRAKKQEDNNKRRSGPWVVLSEAQTGIIQAMHSEPTSLMRHLTASTLSLTQSTTLSIDSLWVLLEARKCKFSKLSLKTRRCHPEFTVPMQQWTAAGTRPKNFQTWQCPSFIHPQRPTRRLRDKFSLRSHQLRLRIKDNQ